MVIPPGVKQIMLQLHGNDTLYWYTAPSGSSSSGSAARHLPPGGSRTFPGIGAETIYFQVATARAGHALEFGYYGDI